VLQGEKEVSAGKHKVRCGQGHMILVTHQLPVVSKIVKASGIDPYIAVILPLDQEKLRRYYEPTRTTGTDNTNVAMASHETDPAILTALGRLLTLADEPEIAPLVAPLVEEEIHARLLHSTMGARLVRLMWHDDKSAHIARVIKLISDDLANNLSIPELADTVGLSKSALHLHFKAVTGMSPLAYSKELRLLKAQTFVRDSNRPISMIGYDVGYESPAQFSREYARKFDLTPRQDRLAFR
jgi:AraC-like DNA-binding protein